MLLYGTLIPAIFLQIQNQQILFKQPPDQLLIIYKSIQIKNLFLKDCQNSLAKVKHYYISILL
ncbi:unnamed protein product [Paramecium pentaurelia]|uniref:Uncharacterized protein n=1 Tax=Paramecium pentaurelia TaxID=43138 RepID=A0A8S1WVU6_9CILI|nr:unnamed protein product [Paramecium pentaurelia]